MGFFGKKKEVIPDVAPLQPAYNAARQAPQQPPGPPQQQYGQQGGQSQYGQQPGGYAQRPLGAGASRYARPESQSQGYSNGSNVNGGYGDANSRRAELLRGAPPPQQGGLVQGGYQPGGIGGKVDGEGNDSDDEVEGIKQQLRFTKQESLASTRNALRIAQEAEMTGRATLDKLAEQGDRLANAERHVDMAKAHNSRAADETKNLEALNRSIFRPNLTFNKTAKREKEEARILARHAQEKDERDQLRQHQYDSRQRMENTYKGMDRATENSVLRNQQARAKGAERGRYQFEATASDDEVEDEIDDNLNQLSGVVGNLKMLAMATGNEIDSHNRSLNRMGGKVDQVDMAINKTTNHLGRIK